jgi:predicted secreted hydrolase
MLEGFRRAEVGQMLQFPEDFGPHPDYQTEWWYYTGNLVTESGRRFGYQLTFFRRALVPASAEAKRLSDWSAEQVYMAHFALSDITEDEHYSVERFSRGSAGLAGAAAEPYEVWLEDWRVREEAAGVYALYARQEGLEIDLILQDEKGPILHGQEGYSQKGSDPGNASYYYSQTRLNTSGEIGLNDETFEVAGMSWKDHEYSTNALSPGQVGWDWFSFQLQDDFDLMVFQIRRADGSIDPFSSGSLIGPNGMVNNLRREDFEIQVTDRWRSPDSGVEYPAGWMIVVPKYDLELLVSPSMADQEMDVSYLYWEGAVDVEGQRAGVAIEGQGYVELSGYGASMEGEF